MFVANLGYIVNIGQSELLLKPKKQKSNNLGFYIFLFLKKEWAYTRGKGLPNMREDLSLIPSNHVKMPGAVASSCNLREVDTGWTSCLTGWPA